MSAITEAAKLSGTNSALADAKKRALGAIATWQERAQSRRTLARMDARLWRDIGMTPTEASNEINKPFWRE